MTEQEKQIEEMVFHMCDDLYNRRYKSCKLCNASNPNTRAYCRLKHYATDLYNAGYRKVEQSEWISVEDRLPKNNLARVLVFLKDAEFTRPIGFNKIDTDRCIDGKWARWGEYVTHWQPLPQPPKMRGE